MWLKVHSIGYIPISSIILNIIWRITLSFVLSFFINSYKISNGPAVLPFGNKLITIFISFFVTISVSSCYQSSSIQNIDWYSSCHLLLYRFTLGCLVEKTPLYHFTNFSSLSYQSLDTCQLYPSPTIIAFRSMLLFFYSNARFNIVCWLFIRLLLHSSIFSFINVSLIFFSFCSLCFIQILKMLFDTLIYSSLSLFSKGDKPVLLRLFKLRILRSMSSFCIRDFLFNL